MPGGTRNRAAVNAKQMRLRSNWLRLRKNWLGSLMSLTPPPVVFTRSDGVRLRSNWPHTDGSMSRRCATSDARKWQTWLTWTKLR
eukprot:COSAG02_NODE_9049_length_2349_cov_81.229575_1_plen_85_part_00